MFSSVASSTSLRLNAGGVARGVATRRRLVGRFGRARWWRLVRRLACFFARRFACLRARRLAGRFARRVAGRVLGAGLAAGAAAAGAAVLGEKSRHALCMKRDVVGVSGVPEPPYGTGEHAVASRTAPVVGSR